MSQKTHIERASVAAASVKGHRSSREPALARLYVLREVGVVPELQKQCSANCDSRKQQRRQLLRLGKFAMKVLAVTGA